MGTGDWTKLISNRVKTKPKQKTCAVVKFWRPGAVYHFRENARNWRLELQRPNRSNEIYGEIQEMQMGDVGSGKNRNRQPLEVGGRGTL